MKLAPPARAPVWSPPAPRSLVLRPPSPRLTFPIIEPSVHLLMCSFVWVPSAPSSSTEIPRREGFVYRRGC